ncbi:MAG: TolB family protein [Spirulinaceae cyanobacterium SM2_1_0]|nr:TolB family protein [Spirulinaceae cyanobacterium SM2_1_0]
MWRRSQLWQLSAAIALLLLSGCTGYPRLLNFPQASSGRSLNTANSELTPHLADNLIVFVSDRNGSPDIYLFDADRRQLISLPGLNALDATVSDPTISEDGRYIAYTASRYGVTDIYLYDRETSSNRNLTDALQAEVRHPAISADGERIAFAASRSGQWDVLIYNRQGRPVNP